MARARAIASLLAGLAALALAQPAGAAPRAPNHEQWATHLAAARGALDVGDLAAAQGATQGMLAEALLFSDRDHRLRETHEILQKAIAAVYASDEAAGEAFLQELVALAIAEAPDRFLAIWMRRQLADRLRAKGDIAAAEAMVEALYRDVEAAFGPDHPETIGLLNLRAYFANARRRGDSLALAERAVEKSSQVLGPAAPQTARALLQLGRVLAREQRWDEAEATWGRALESAQQFGELSPMVGEVEADLAWLALARDEFPLVLQRAARARSIFEANYGPHSDGVSRTSRMMATAHFARGDLAEALENAQRAHEASLGTKAPRSTPAALALLQIARIQEAAGSLEEARQAFENARGLLDAKPKHYAIELHALGFTAELLGHTEQALAYLERAWTRLQEDEAPADRSEADLKRSLAYSLARAGRFERARELAEEALAAFEALLGPDHTDTAYTLDTLGVALAGAGELERALASQDRALAIVRDLVDERSPYVLEIASHRAETLRRLGREDEAQRILARVAAARSAHRTSLAALASKRVDPLRFEAKNFRITLPDSEWWIVDEEGFGDAEVDAIVMRRSPFIDFVATGYAGLDLDVGRRLAELEAGFRENHDGYRRISERELELAGVAGRALRGAYDGPDGTIHVEVWVGSRNGFHYELEGCSRGEEAPPDAVWRQVARIHEGFALLDPARQAGPSADGLVLASEPFGYSIDLTGGPWVASPERFGVDLAELAAGNRTTSIVSLPVSLVGLDVADEDLARALLEAGTLEQPETLTPLDEPGAQGLEGGFEREQEGKQQHFRIRILRKGDLACLVSVASLEKDELEVVERFRWDADAPAPELAGLDETARLRQQKFLDALATRYLQARRIVEGVAAMALRAELTPGDLPFLEQLATYQLGLSRFKEASATASAGLAQDDTRPVLWALRGNAQHKLTGAKAAEPDYRRAAELGYREEAFLSEYARALWELGRQQETFALLDTAIEETGSRRLRLERANWRREAGDWAAARDELLALDAAMPDDAEVLVGLALVHVLAGEHAQAVAVCDRLLSQVPGSWELHYLKAQALFGAGRLADARSTVDRAAELNPQSEEVRELQRLVSGSLGMGTTAGVLAAIEPVTVPTELLPAKPAAKPLESQFYGAYYRYWSRAVRFEPNTPYRATMRFRAAVTRAGGLEQFGTLTFDFNPLWERIYINTLDVFDASGELVAQGDPERYYVLDASNGIAGSERVLHAPVPGLAVGGELEVAVTLEELHPRERYRFVDFHFSRTIPVLRSLLYVEGDTGDLQASQTEGVTAHSGKGWRAWTADQPEPYRWEPLQFTALEHLPRLRLSDGRDSWDALASDYLASLTERLAPAPEAAALAAQGGAGEGARAEPRELAALVQDRLRYEAVIFGPRARMPKPVADALRDGYGDCKDHALLLLQLLREQGFEAHLALMGTAGAFESKTPSLDQFDHMIVWCGDCLGARFIDATDKDAELAVGPPRALGGRTALILDPQKPRFETIDDLAPERLAVEITREIGLSSEGALSVQEQVVLTGEMGAAMRGSLRSMDRSTWEEAVLREILTQDKPLSVSEVSIANLEEVAKPLEISLTYEIEQAFTRTPDQLLGSLPAGWERMYLGADAVKQRGSPFEVVPARVTTTQHLRLPPGYTLAQPIRGGSEPGAQFLRWKIENDPAQPGLRIRFEAARVGGRFPAEDYARYHREASRAQTVLGSPIEVLAGR